MEALPFVDYAPETLLGVGVLMVFFGLLVPYRTVKQLLERIKYLEGALGKEQAAHSETLRQRGEEQKTFEVVRRLFDGLERRRDG